MSTQKRNQLSEIMNLAWQMVKRNGYSMSEALKCAWCNIKLRALLHKKIVEFYFKKTDGTLRQAFGTLKEGLIGETKGTGRKPNENLQVYWDTEKEEYRCFKKCNLVRFSK
ncbi:SH3 beta-barrel fold-containing protein [Paraprevotella xylaniphila]|uniref:SH3 beta-barrel fold-containing protein n=1 Tax=Paraprevotella xylaniphila TaxID=454155 RepID=UPI0010329A68|nr:SH3 beta-barrel fold-containing protein [Paraprevotella xylaniphila]